MCWGRGNLPLACLFTVSDAADLGRDSTVCRSHYRFDPQSTHRRRKHFFECCTIPAPPPQAVPPHCRHIWSWPLSLPPLPAVAPSHTAPPGPATQLASGLLPKVPCPHKSLCPPPSWAHRHRLRRGHFVQLRSGPEESPLAPLTKINMKPGRWAAGLTATHRSLSSASGLPLVLG